ncbi:hypothetical protein MKZ38_007974 [Zalerion maritima]|uniref:Uncharacterized protein n=1 Tax=Zalerion maritima TaxID=339359 RepID=A0AAD5RIF6_9PEZI|nr:hypothetical protein MKZ38_007974 [Zalerion maritima]
MSSALISSLRSTFDSSATARAAGPSGFCCTLDGAGRRRELMHSRGCRTNTAFHVLDHCIKEARQGTKCDLVVHTPPTTFPDLWTMATINLKNIHNYPSNYTTTNTIKMSSVNSAFTVSEPHPTVTKGAYIHSGRGGAGNYFRAPQTTPSSGVATRVSSTTSAAPRRFYSGRGGAGNAHVATEAPTLDLNEEYLRIQHRDANDAGHVGRGGAGNFFKSSGSSAKSQTSSRRSSNESDNSSRSSGFWARLSGASLHH